MRHKQHPKKWTRRRIRNAILFGLAGVAAATFAVYYVLLKPNAADPRFAAWRVKGAAENPNSPEVQKVIDSGRAVRIDLAGCPNLHKVSDGLYRGAQPTQEGFANLQKLGVKTIVNLRDHHSDTQLLANTQLAYKEIPLDTWKITAADITAFLRIAADPNQAPVFVHCQHGADRTGVMTASYRIAAEYWEKSRAIAEMTHGGYGFHPLWSELPELIHRTDYAAMRRAAGLPEKPMSK